MIALWWIFPYKFGRNPGEIEHFNFGKNSFIATYSRVIGLAIFYTVSGFNFNLYTQIIYLLQVLIVIEQSSEQNILSLFS